jgi:hypothetical protein
MSLFQLDDEEPFAAEIAMAQSHRNRSLHKVTAASAAVTTLIDCNNNKNKNSSRSSLTKNKQVCEEDDEQDCMDLALQKLTGDEKATLKARKIVKKQSKLRQKYKLESLRNTFLALEDENVRLRGILQSSTLSSTLVAQILEKCTMASPNPMQMPDMDEPQFGYDGQHGGASEDTSITSSKDGCHTVIATGNGTRRRRSQCKNVDVKDAAAPATTATAMAMTISQLHIQEDDNGHDHTHCTPSSGASKDTTTQTQATKQGDCTIIADPEQYTSAGGTA